MAPKTLKRPGILKKTAPGVAIDAYKTVQASELRANSSTIVESVAHGDEPVIITRSGKPYAAIVPLVMLELIRQREDAIDIAAARAARRDIAKHGTISLDELKAHLNL